MVSLDARGPVRFWIVAQNGERLREVGVGPFMCSPYETLVGLSDRGDDPVDLTDHLSRKPLDSFTRESCRFIELTTGIEYIPALDAYGGDGVLPLVPTDRIEREFF